MGNFSSGKADIEIIEAIDFMVERVIKLLLKKNTFCIVLTAGESSTSGVGESLDSKLPAGLR